MPLPTAGSLTLQGHSRPGEGTTAKPKQAMIVRMSEDTLDALQDITSEERMDFVFGDNPGIYIRDVFFPMRASYETTSHELFIRTTKAQRPSASLKLNADVFGRFDVERDLSEKLTKRIHDASVAAAKQKTERKVMMLDAPLVEATGTKKGKAPPKSRARSLLASSSTKPSPRVSSPLTRSIAQPQPAASSSSAPPKEGNSPIRARLVHFLALGSQSTEEVVKVIGGGTSDLTVRTKIVQVLEDVAEKEPAPKNAAKLPSSKESWRLKQETWLDVRPHQYADYTDNERVAVARTARVWLKNMKIPDADPAWEHVRYRANGTSIKPSVPSAANPSTPSNSTSGIGALKTSSDFKGVRTKEVKEKKPKPIALAEMKIKSEAVPSRVDSGSRPSSSKAGVAPLENGHGKDKEWEEGELAATPPRPAIARKPPPPKSATPQGQNTASSDPQGSLKKRTGPVDARATKKEPPPPSESARPAPPLPPPAQTEKKSTPIPKIIKKEKEHVVPKDIERARDAETRKPSAGTKRKQPSHEYTDSDDEESSMPLNEVKRKKLADSRGGSSAARPIKEEPRRSQDSLAPPKKPIKREPSPASLPQHVKPRKDGISSEGASSSRHVSAARSDRSTTGSGSKLRRKSPIYTSSDEEETVKPKHAPTTHVTTLKAWQPAPLPLDHAGLRARYSSTYMEYLGVFTKVVAERTKIESALKRNVSSSGGVTDSEGDTDMLSAGELEKLSERHRNLHEELLNIKQAWEFVGWQALYLWVHLCCERVFFRVYVAVPDRRSSDDREGDGGVPITATCFRNHIMEFAYNLLDKGLIPDVLLRPVIRALCRQRLREIDLGSFEANHAAKMKWIEQVRARPTIADLTEKANEQHYEVSTKFILSCLGPYAKYSSCLYPTGKETLEEAEVLMLESYCEKAQLRDGQDILDLGCGWGSLSLYLAQKYPHSRIRGFTNLQIITGDVNTFDFTGTRFFDRILSIEMFEHMKNYEQLMRKISTWLRPSKGDHGQDDALLFIHIFCHRTTPYHFEEGDGWMAKTFFSGGTMPSHDLLLYFQSELTLVKSWYLDGRNYSRTLEDWLKLQDRNAKEGLAELERDAVAKGMSKDEGRKAFYRFRVFYIACAEFFGLNSGQEWGVGHYLFREGSWSAHRGQGTCEKSETCSLLCNLS